MERKTWNERLRLVAALVLMGGLVYAVLAGGTGARPGPLAGKPAPAVVLPPLAGGPAASLLADSDRGVVLFFWATWCKACKPNLEWFARRHGHSAAEGARPGPRIVTVVSEPAEDVVVTLNRLGLAGADAVPVWLDPDGAAFRAYGVGGLPHTVFIAPDGMVVADFMGPLEATALREEFRRLEALPSRP